LGNASWWTVCVFVTDLTIRLLLSVRVVMRRLPIGVSLAWLFIVLTFPFAGAIAYLFIGELRLGQRRAARSAQLRTPFHRWLAELKTGEVDWSTHPPSSEALARMCETMIGMPVTSGNRLELLASSECGLVRLIKDIDAARKSLHLEFYIWAEGGLADEVAHAVLRAAARGVICRVLLDDVGSREFLRGDWARRFREGGVAMQAALPARIWRLPFVRFDLRLHRKIAVIDGRIAYTGSMNLVDSRFFKQTAGVGIWVDAVARIEGPAVEPLGVTFLGDWAQESQEPIERLRVSGDVQPISSAGPVPVQVIPSGPAHAWAAIERIVIGTIYSAQKRLTLTTPYFVPDEAMVTALISAAQRGVDVTLILPEKVDSRLASWASRANQGDLVAGGVRVLLFRGGLLHTKSVAVDGEYSLFGSLNLDPRSLHLNFEITLAIYDAAFTTELEELQQEYARESRVVNLAEWRSRGLARAFLENVARLLGPLL
jgi:cardiolipin synthase A/B